MGGGILGLAASRFLSPSERSIVFIHAGSGARECRMAFSIETRAAWGGPASTGDGGGTLRCDEKSEVAPGLWVGCECPPDQGSP